jgi:GNAT superfamily N-acetyltransferase
MRDIPADDVTTFFRPERPGPLIHPHIEATGIGGCRVDRWPAPRTVVAELPGGNVAVRGEPRVLPGLAGFIEASPDWLPALRETDPGTAVWPRLIAVLPDDVDVAGTRHPVRRLTPADTGGLTELHPSITWISETWGGPSGLAASSRAYAAFVGGRPIAVACSFYVGRRYEDIGVVTEPAHRGRGLSTACAAALVHDIRSRGRRPTWTTSPDNVASRRVAEHLGFVHHRDDVLYAVHTPIPISD